VDLTYRTELRELNELNFARFDAKLEQRLAELRAGLRTEFQCGLHDLPADLIKWLGLWGTMMLTQIGIIVALLSR
jgi:hypothetical protein